MIIYRDKTIQEPSAIVCDKCGRKAGEVQDCFEFQEFLSIDHTGGYGSIIGEDVQYQLDLCQYCAKELLLPYARVKQ